MCTVTYPKYWICIFCGGRLVFDMGMDEMSDGSLRPDEHYVCEACGSVYEARSRWKHTQVEYRPAYEGYLVTPEGWDDGDTSFGFRE